MRKALFAFGLALALLTGQAAPALAAGKKGTKEAQATNAAPAADWSAVLAIPAGEKIVLRMKDGQRYEGRFESASDLLVNILRNGRSMSLERERIRRVSQKGGMSRTNGALWGAAIGGGSGAIVGGGLYDASDGEFVGAVISVTALLGAGIGAGIGALFGKGKRDVTIYEAP